MMQGGKDRRRIAALDPGREKCGFAVLERAAGGAPRVLLQRVIETRALEREVKEAFTALSPALLVMGNGTTSKEARARLARAFPALPVAVVDEYSTTDLARGEYWRAHPPRGLRRLLPTSMQVPPVPVDDFVAVILGTRFLAREAQEERGTKL